MEEESSHGGVGTSLLERPQEVGNDHDDERFSHYVRKDRLTESMVMGKPVVALCGKVWLPTRDASSYPVCPMCKEISKQIGNQGSQWPLGPDVPGSDV
ncbi:MAG: DUF3039 domain-containing protein [Actinomycetaceae bacterium]|nr:DUF3039 domain-containing protein [Actinomycetaceae bacterium]